MNHLKEEWHYEFSKMTQFSPNGHFVVKSGNIGRPICIVPMPIGGINPKQKQKAITQLITCSPELLEQLEYCVKALKVITSQATKPIIERAENTIKKARGL